MYFIKESPRISSDDLLKYIQNSLTSNFPHVHGFLGGCLSIINVRHTSVEVVTFQMLCFYFFR